MEWLTALGIMFGIATGIGGLWLGIDNRRTHERERLDREKVLGNIKSAARTLIRLELEQNQTALSDIWQHTVMVLPSGTPLEQQFKQRLALIETPLPSWQRAAWSNLTPELALAFEPDLLREIRTLYARLDSLTERVGIIKGRMNADLKHDYDEYRAGIPPQKEALEDTLLAAPIQSFVTDTQPLWSECGELYRQLDFGKVLVAGQAKADVLCASLLD